MTAFENLFLLRAFVAIVESGSVSGGARRLRMSQPTLSRHLRTLEDQCGTTLLRRDTHGMCLTEAGRRLLREARAVLAHAEEADRRLREEDTSLSGPLRLFATIDCGQSVVTRMVSRFLQDHPRVTITLTLNNRPLHMIQEGCDVGILPGKITDESVIARPAGLISLHLAASPALLKLHPTVRKMTDLKNVPWVAMAGRQFWGSSDLTLLDRKGSEQTLRLSPILISEGLTSVWEAARAGLGFALLPDWMIQDDLHAGRLVSVLPHLRAKDLPIHIVYARQRFLSLRVSAFINFAVQYMKEELRQGNRLPRKKAASAR